MAKYIDADQIRAKIERRLKNTRDHMNGIGMKYKGPNYFEARGRESAYDALLNFLDTLLEQPEGLDKAARLYAIPHYTKDIDMNHIEEYPYDSGLEAAFIAGAEWMAKHN